MVKEYIAQLSVDEVQYFIDFFTNNIQQYRLSEITNDNCPDLPSINGAHPLAMEYGALLSSSDPENYTSFLPAIGVELIDGGEADRKTMGRGYKVEEATSSWINSIKSLSPKDRFKSGIFAADTTINNIDTMKTAKGSEKLYARSNKYMQNNFINVSVWSFDIDLTRAVFLVTRALLHRTKLDISGQGGKNLSVNEQGALYDFTFGETAFGAEFQVRFINVHKNIEVDDSLDTLKSVEHHFESGKAGPKLTSISGEGSFPVEDEE